MKVTLLARRARAEARRRLARRLDADDACRSSSGVLLRAEAGRLHLAATDMELSLRASLDARGRGRRLRRRARPAARRPRAAPAGRRGGDRAPADEGVVHVDVRLVASYALQHLQRRGLPAPARGRRSADVHASSAKRCSRRSPASRARRLATSRGRCSPGSSSGSSRGKLVMAATDSYRLVREGDRARGRRCPSSRRSSRRARSASSRASRTSGDEIELGVHENQVVFGADGVWLTTRRIDGQFPNYRQLLPEAFEHELTLPRGGAARRRSPRRA